MRLGRWSSNDRGRRRDDGRCLADNEQNESTICTENCAKPQWALERADKGIATHWPAAHEQLGALISIERLDARGRRTQSHKCRTSHSIDRQQTCLIDSECPDQRSEYDHACRSDEEAHLEGRRGKRERQRDARSCQRSPPVTATYIRMRHQPTLASHAIYRCLSVVT